MKVPGGAHRQTIGIGQPNGNGGNQLGGRALGVSQVRLSNFLAYRDDNTFPANHRSESESANLHGRRHIYFWRLDRWHRDWHVVKQVTPASQPRKLSGPPPPLPSRRRAGQAPLLVDALEKFKVNVETRAFRASSMVKPWEVRGSNKEERITKPL